MRYLLENYANKGIGFPEEGFLQAIEAVSGSDFDEFYRLTVQSRKDIDYNRFLIHAGLRVEVANQPSSIYVGIEFDRAPEGQPRVRRIALNSPAERAQFDTGDVLLAMNKERLTFENFRSRLHSYGIGASLQMEVMRGERLLTLDLVPVEFQDQQWSIVQNPDATPEQLKLRSLWLGVSEN
jgi:predicted metalloprotease with PDZ domain